MNRIARTTLVAAVSGAAIAAGGAAFSSGSTTSQDKSRDVAVNVSDAPAASAHAPARHRRHTHRVVLVHFGGHKHSCAASVVPALHNARARIAPLAKRTYASETALRKLQRKYAKKSASAAAVARYDTLYKSYKAELRRTKRAIHTYNAMLSDKCGR